jgi:putative NADH-flavin reductase
MKLLVLGANGKVGSRVCSELLERGHTVIASVHKSDSAVPKAATIHRTDLHDKSSVEEALKGCDAVICALSSWKSPDHDVLSSTMKTVVPAMEREGVRRIVSISGNVARLPNETPSLPLRVFHALLFGVPKQVIADSENHIAQLVSSHLDWTVIRPGIMTDSQHASYQLQLKPSRAMTIPRAAVVASLVDLVESSEFVHEAPYITRSK